jgi:hypothetical protein
LKVKEQMDGKNKQDGIDIGFALGVCWAVARIVDMHGQDTIAAEILRESGVDAGRYADAYDYRLLKIADPTLRRPRKRVNK